MRASTFVALAAVVGCGAGQATIGSSVGRGAPESTEPADGASAAAGPESTPPHGAEAEHDEAPEPLPPPDPALVRDVVAKTGSAAGPGENLLGLRLEVTPRPAGERWLLAVVNRGTASANVSFDLRHLTLELQPPEPTVPRPKWKSKPAPEVCRLPEGFARGLDADDEPYLLAPGEGLVQTFDPRLYCISSAGDSMLEQGQQVTVRLGFAPKPPRTVWQAGKRVEVPDKQVPPFVAAPTAPSGELDQRVKRLQASAFEVTADITGGEAEEDPSLPLQLRLVRGSDASTERTATITVQVKARERSQLYFRRELLSFTVHGPDGIRGCYPQPDDRAPDRQAYSTLHAGSSLSATSLLAELCPNFTFGRPGLYLVSARMDANRDGAELGLRAFIGRLESRRQALVRITMGDLPPRPAPPPLRVRVGE